MNGARFDAWTRRRLGLALGGVGVSLLGLTARDEASARKNRKKKKRCRKVGRSCKRGKECCGSLKCALAGEPERRRCCRNEGGGCASSSDCCGVLLCTLDNLCQLPVSDRALKANFGSVDGTDLLARVRELPITTWNYTSDVASIRHIGPMAQDFTAAFGVGADDRHIHPIDAQGVAFSAIQGLIAEVDGLRSENAQLAARLAALEQSRPRV